jgi:predicted transposase/invertase (TIGR01784 family)
MSKQSMPDPRRDRMFKYIFHSHPSALISLLNAFLPLPDPIEGISYEPHELQSDRDGLHLAIVDVRCVDGKGRQFIVEMQIQKTPHLLRRVLMNASRIYGRQGGVGVRLVDVFPVYTLCFLDHSLYPDDPDWLHHMETCVPGSPDKRIGEMFFTFVEMRKWMKSGKFDMEDERDTWMLFFTQPEKMKDIYTPEQRRRYKEMWEAVDAWDLTRYSKEELLIMDQKVRDMWTHESFVQIYRDEGRAEGREEGRVEGREEGREEGMEIIMSAYRFLKEHPDDQDESLMARFGLTREMVVKVRSMLKG